MNRDDWRHANACIRCYSHKLKCRRPPTQLTCLRCATLQVQCTPRVPKRHRGSSNLPSPATTVASELPNGSPQTTTRPPRGTTTKFPPALYHQVSAPELSEDANMQNWTDGFFAEFTPEQSGMSDICDDADLQNWTDNFSVDFAQDTSALRYSDKDMWPESAPIDTVTENATSCSSSTTVLPSRAILSGQQSSRMHWIEDMHQISMQLLTFSTSGTASPPDHTNNTGHISSRIEDSFTLATKLLAVMKQMIPSSTVSSQAKSPSTLEPAAYGDSLVSKSSLRSREKEYTLLEEQSDGLLFMSSYMRLLSIFNNHLDRLESDVLQPLARPDANAQSRRGDSSTPDQPVAQNFMVVSMIEFHLRRVGSVLRELTQCDDAARQSDANEVSHGRGDSAFGSGKGLDLMLPVLYEQQALLLRRVCRARAQLMAAQGQ